MSAAVMPAARAVVVSMTADHQSAGIESRCHHLDTAEALAPMSDAIASFEGQRSIIERNVIGPIMPSLIGQTVLNCNDKTSYDCGNEFADNAAMADRMSETEETAAFIGRVKFARENKFTTQKPVYRYLEIPQDQYKHYETKRPLPRRYIPKFCEITEVSMEWLLTGEGKGPVVAEIPKQAPRRMGRPAKGRAA